MTAYEVLDEIWQASQKYYQEQYGRNPQQIYMHPQLVRMLDESLAREGVFTVTASYDKPYPIRRVFGIPITESEQIEGWAFAL